MIEKIITNFKIPGDFIEARSFGNGHINETYLVKFVQTNNINEYILRKINRYVFKDPKIVVDNSIKVIEHITNKLSKTGISDISNRVMKFIETKDSNYYYLDENNDYWCAVVFIKNAYTVEYVETADQAYQAAKAFGSFQKYLIDADINGFKESIPNFHDLASRLVAFDIALNEDPVGRMESVKKEIQLVNSYRFLSEKITSLLKKNELPIRITHNDTKINNVMLNRETNEGQCVIDLDTVMPGTVLYDFGDMVRSSTSLTNEDERDVAKVTMRIEIFDALAKGYLEELADVLEEVETNNLVYGAKVIVYEQAIRFLTDHIMDDPYYNIDYSEQNLDRARTQFALLESIEDQTDTMEKIIKKYS